MLNGRLLYSYAKSTTSSLDLNLSNTIKRLGDESRVILKSATFSGAGTIKVIKSTGVMYDGTARTASVVPSFASSTLATPSNFNEFLNSFVGEE